MQSETAWGRIKRRASENPFIVAAMGLTVYSMVQMAKNLLKRDRNAFQSSQRHRVASQFAAFLAFGIGAWYYSLPKDSKELEARQNNAVINKNKEE